MSRYSSRLATSRTLSLLTWTDAGMRSTRRIHTTDSSRRASPLLGTTLSPLPVHRAPTPPGPFAHSAAHPVNAWMPCAPPSTGTARGGPQDPVRRRLQPVPALPRDRHELRIGAGSTGGPCREGGCSMPSRATASSGQAGLSSRSELAKDGSQGCKQRLRGRSRDADSRTELGRRKRFYRLHEASIEQNQLLRGGLYRDIARRRSPRSSHQSAFHFR